MQNMHLHLPNKKISISFTFNTDTSLLMLIVLVWWLWRMCNTRSHPELDSETVQRLWYFVLRHGKVGRCQTYTINIKSIFLSKSLPPYPQQTGWGGGLCIPMSIQGFCVFPHIPKKIGHISCPEVFFLSLWDLCISVIFRTHWIISSFEAHFFKLSCLMNHT